MTPHPASEYAAGIHACIAVCEDLLSGSIRALAYVDAAPSPDISTLEDAIDEMRALL